jgi:hypothetical protein
MIFALKAAKPNSLSVVIPLRFSSPAAWLTNERPYSTPHHETAGNPEESFRGSQRRAQKSGPLRGHIGKG